MKVGIVCGYGTYVNKNMLSYIASVSQFSIKNKIDVLILSGGYTSKSKNISEASVMSSLLEKHIDIEKKLEENSLTTLHNLLYSKKIIEPYFKDIDRIYVFCDNIRFFKVFNLSKLIFKGKKLKVVKIYREEPLKVYFLQIPSLMNQCLGVIFPNIERKILKQKKIWIARGK